MILYSTGCPKCKVLETKLNSANIKYDICDDIDIMTQKNFMTLPMFETDEGKIMDFSEAVKWVNNLI